jgi:hypothetical protein|tara:strand:- start:376 stop:798 length:423 start_codon:yes stop_codon:yes gene_type:complete
MIKYTLKCHKEHEFESWFSDSKEFDKLNKKRLLECIYCNSKKIAKSIMAPRVKGANLEIKSLDLIEKKSPDKKIELIKLREYVEKNFEFVGNNFKEKVREIYYDKKSNKSIYGTTSEEDREELADEGIELLSIPWISKDN